MAIHNRYKTGAKGEGLRPPAFLKTLKSKNMSKIIDKGVSYSAATGVLIVITEMFLLRDEPNPKIAAEILVKVIEDQPDMPESVMRLVYAVKQKYNL